MGKTRRGWSSQGDRVMAGQQVKVQVNLTQPPQHIGTRGLRL